MIGHLAAGNLGDEMMLRGLLPALRSRGHRVVVLRSRPSDWCDPRPDEPGIRYAPRLGLTRAARIRRPLLLCGGSHFHDADAGQPRARHLVAMGLLAAQLLATRVGGGRYHLVSIGLGPFHSRLGRGLTRLVLRAASTVTVRDEASRRWAEELAGVDAPLVDDLALCCEELRSARPSPGGPVLVVPVPDPTSPGGTQPSSAEVEDLSAVVGGRGRVALLSINGVEANRTATAATAATLGW